MRQSIFLVILLVQGCSLSTPQNEWQYKSARAFSSFSQNYLSDNGSLAQNDLSRAIKSAKQSADLTQLAKIYLGECALHIATGIDDDCKHYANMENLLENKTLSSYYHLLRKNLQNEEINFLPSSYQKFAVALSEKDFVRANKEVLSIKKISSSFVCASLIKEELTDKTRENIIQKASFSGYKKVVLFWLREVKKVSTNRDEIKRINQKIVILQSKD